MNLKSEQFSANTNKALIHKKVHFGGEFEQLLNIFKSLYEAALPRHSEHPGLAVTTDPHSCLGHGAIIPITVTSASLAEATNQLKLQEKLLLSFIIIRHGPARDQVACAVDNVIRSGPDCFAELTEFVNACEQTWSESDYLDLRFGELFLLFTNSQKSLGFVELRQDSLSYESGQFVCSKGRYSELIKLGFDLFTQGLRALDTTARHLNTVLGKHIACDPPKLFSCSFGRHLSPTIDAPWVQSEILNPPERAKREGLINWLIADNEAERKDLRRVSNANLRNIDVLSENVQLINQELGDVGDFVFVTSEQLENDTSTLAFEFLDHQSRSTLWQTLLIIRERSTLAVAQMERFLILLQQILHETILKKEQLQKDLTAGSVCSSVAASAQVCSVSSPILNYQLTKEELKVKEHFPFVKFSSEGNEFPLTSVVIPYCLANADGYIFSRNKMIMHKSGEFLYNHEATFRALCVEQSELDIPECNDLMVPLEAVPNPPDKLPGGSIGYVLSGDWIYLQPLDGPETVQQDGKHYSVDRYQVLKLSSQSEFWINSHKTPIDPGVLSRVDNDFPTLETLRLGAQVRQNIRAQQTDNDFLETNKLRPDWRTHLFDLKQILATNPAAKAVSVVAACLLASGFMLCSSLCCCVIFRLEKNRRAANQTYQQTLRELRGSLQPVRDAVLGPRGAPDNPPESSWWRRILCCQGRRKLVLTRKEPHRPPRAPRESKEREEERQSIIETEDPLYREDRHERQRSPEVTFTFAPEITESLREYKQKGN